MVSDGELEEYLEKRLGSQVVLFSWSRRFNTSRPWKTNWAGSPVPLAPLFEAWDDSTPVVLNDVLRVLHRAEGASDHGNHPSAIYTSNLSVPLSTSVLISWLVQGCLNWEARISGPLFVDLPVWMGDQQDEAVVIHACAEAEVGNYHVYNVWVRVDPPPGQDVTHFNFSIPVAWTVGLPWGLSGPLRRELDQCILP